MQEMSVVRGKGDRKAENLERNQNDFEGYPPEIWGKRNINLTDHRLEYHDPTPNIHDLFVSFDKRFFWGKLGMVEVKWSNRMTTCAGICSYQGRKGLCSIKLSAPLLILRPRKDLVETLLHEMIHAYLFVTRNFKDREDHGPEFHNHMHRINKEAGTNITVFHSFHYEVDFYRTHIWRCNGPCRNRQPFFGLVKRAMNRAPGPNDLWWEAHSINCGGTFEKISEPEKQSKKKNGDKIGKSHTTTSTIRDIRDFLQDTHPKPSMPTHNQAGHSNSTSNHFQNGEPSKANKQNGGNMVVSRGTHVNNPKPGTSQSNYYNYGEVGDEQAKIRETVRNVWINKYPSQNETSKKRSNSNAPELIDLTTEPKKKQLTCPVCARPVSETEINEHLDKCLTEENPSEITVENLVSEEEDDEPGNYVVARCPVCGEGLEENELSEHLEVCFSFTFENDDTAGDDQEDTDKVPCPCCLKWVKQKTINEHIDECLTLMTLKQTAGIN